MVILQDSRKRARRSKNSLKLLRQEEEEEEEEEEEGADQVSGQIATIIIIKNQIKIILQSRVVVEIKEYTFHHFVYFFVIFCLQLRVFCSFFVIVLLLCV